ncbi:HlyD family type I secretion periplasmic adaptor subunit [Kineobactrum sediminis]|uniref:Membrane fusion protein (MFP) family protein n=1 Tax=Kineobactrum sediminis TaxID=1905677 RepID=A0A2N5Y5Y3_9GAMM|nr:HlyD family type I secretion periplasmic adaptor subunit [Kineobactrum sediminis]PLW83791.1 HlyD family type I secretion periplasmic adaptor subunit [Kineobactrum sediminis]
MSDYPVVASEPEAPANEPRKRHLADFIFAPWLKDTADTPGNWEHNAHSAYLEQQPLRARKLLYIVGVIVLALLIWAALATVDEVTRGDGRVIPSQQIQIMQSQDGGVVTEINVRAGDIVEAGQLLVRLDQTRSESNLRENQAEFQALSVRAERLGAMLAGVEFIPAPEWLEQVGQIVDQEKALFESSKAQLLLQQQIAGEQLEQRQQELAEMNARSRQMSVSLDLTRQELGVTRPMVSSGAVSRVEILRLEREVNQLSGEYDQTQAQIQRLKSAIQEARGKLSEVEVDFENEVRGELTDTIARMNGLREAGIGLSDRVQQTELRSPVKGTVKRLYYNTIGGVVLPGKEIVEVVPLDDTLLVEVRIRPQDIAFLIPGQKAMVKLTAYDFVVYGGMEGTVEHIGADTIMDDEGNPFYEVHVRTKEVGFGKDMPIIPGMTVQVDILTGKKTVLAYLMKPVLRAKQYALTER